MLLLPTNFFFEAPGVRYTAFAGTCVDKPSKFEQVAPEGYKGLPA